MHYDAATKTALFSVLCYAKIVRVYGVDSKRVGFVHRRFLEYFTTLKLLANPDCIDLHDIPTDSRGRDVLVLLAQNCNLSMATTIAEFCWNRLQVVVLNNTLTIEAVHCLRFLTDAFPSRIEAISNFRENLCGFIHDQLKPEKNLLQAKIGLETTGLLSQQESIPIISTAIQTDNPWLQETALRACRHFSRLEQGLSRDLQKYLIEMPFNAFIENRRSLLFSLSLSGSFSEIRKIVHIRSASLFALALGLAMIFLMVPGLSSLILILPAFFR